MQIKGFDMFAAALALVFALQTTVPGPLLTAEQEAEIAFFAPELGSTMETLGACERLFPEWGPSLNTLFEAPSDDAERAAMVEYVRRAYQRGKASQARAVSPEICQTAVASLQGQMTDLQARLAAAQDQQIPPDLAEQAERAMESVRQMFEILGTCERVFPPEVSTGLRSAFADQSDPDKKAAAELFLSAYDTGKSSPRAATITVEQCMEQLTAVQTRIQSLAAEIEATPPNVE